jgi:DNA-binding transcriptional LysR family regulator
MRINVTPQQLNCFLRISEAGSFSAAAKQLGVSQPALSRTIRLIEEALGTRLFDRDTRNVMLTPAGLELRPIAGRLLAEFQGAFGELAQFIAGGRAASPSQPRLPLLPCCCRPPSRQCG